MSRAAADDIVLFWRHAPRTYPGTTRAAPNVRRRLFRSFYLTLANVPGAQADQMSGFPAYTAGHKENATSFLFGRPQTPSRTFSSDLNFVLIEFTYFPPTAASSHSRTSKLAIFLRDSLQLFLSFSLSTQLIFQEKYINYTNINYYSKHILVTVALPFKYAYFFLRREAKVCSTALYGS